MKRLTTILYCLSFAIFGIGLALTGNSSFGLNKTQSVSAGTIMKLEMPNGIKDPLLTSAVPHDLVTNMEEKASEGDSITISSPSSSLVDSLKQRIDYLEKKKQVTMVKWRKSKSPPEVRTDTVSVPVYYLATKTGMKEGPDGKCVSVYEVHKVDEICPENDNSSVELSIELDSKEGE